MNGTISELITLEDSFWIQAVKEVEQDLQFLSVEESEAFLQSIVTA
jgi:hypothetical protein